MLIPDPTWMEGVTLSFMSVAAVLSLGTVVLGLYSIITGKDPLPKRVRRLLRRVPASPEDHRMYGMWRTLNGAAIMVVVLAMTANAAGVLNRGPFPFDALFFVTTVGIVTAMVCMVGSYALYLRVRFVSTRGSTDTPVVPPV